MTAYQRQPKRHTAWCCLCDWRNIYFQSVNVPPTSHNTAKRKALLGLKAHMRIKHGK